MDNPGNAPDIKWKLPWGSAAPDASGLQRQLEHELTPAHPLYGKGATVVGFRVDMDDIVAILNDGNYVMVHLLWQAHPEPFPDRFPYWRSYGSQKAFIAAMELDAIEYGDE